MIKQLFSSSFFGFTAIVLGHTAAPTFTYYDVGSNVYPQAISGNEAYIAGYSGSSPEVAFYAPVTWSGTTPMVGPSATLTNTFGTGSPSDFAISSSVATGVNDNGWVVGYYSMSLTNPWGAATNNGFIWVTVGTQFIPPAGWGSNAYNTNATCVNDNYAVAGYSTGVDEAYVYEPTLGYFQTSPYGTGSAQFFGINDYGYTCGCSTGFAASSCAAYVNSSGWQGIQISSGVYDTGGIAYGINNSSQLCGADGTGAWRYGSSTFQYIVSASSAIAWGINDNGYVVGHYMSSGVQHAFLSTSGTSLTDLNTSGVVTSGLPAGYVLKEATAISESNAIVGYAVDSGGNVHGFLLAEN